MCRPNKLALGWTDCSFDTQKSWRATSRKTIRKSHATFFVFLSDRVMGSLLLSLEEIFPSFPFSPRNAWYSDYLLLHSHSLYRHATLLLSCGAFTWYKERLSSRLQSVTLNLGHIALVPAFCLPMLFWNRFSVDLSKFEANFEEREKEVKHSMSTLFLLLTQVLMSQVMGSCPGEGHWVMLALEMSLPI